MEVAEAVTLCTTNVERCAFLDEPNSDEPSIATQQAPPQFRWVLFGEHRTQNTAALAADAAEEQVLGERVAASALLLVSLLLLLCPISYWAAAATAPAAAAAAAASAGC